MTPKTNLSCHKTYKKWYYIIFYLKKRADIIFTFIRFHGRFGGHFEFDL